MAPVIAFEQADNAEGLIQLIDCIQIVPLETDGHFFGWSADLLPLKDGGYLVIDKDNCQIVRYDAKGRFLNLIGEQGNGPGEYPDVSNVQLMDDQVVVFSSPGATWHIFDLGGKYIGKGYTQAGGQQFAIVSEGVLGFNGYGMPEKCKVTLQENSKTTRFYPYSSEIIAFGDINNVFSFEKDQVFVRDQLEPTVYNYYAGKMKPWVSFDFGNHAIAESFYSMDYMTSASYLMETDLCLLSRYQESGGNRLVEVTRPLARHSYYGLYHDGKWMWGYMGVEEKAPFASAIKSIQDNTLYCLVDPTLLKEIEPAWHKKVSNPELIDHLSNADNLAIVLIRLK